MCQLTMCLRNGNAEAERDDLNGGIFGGAVLAMELFIENVNEFFCSVCLILVSIFSLSAWYELLRASN